MSPVGSIKGYKYIDLGSSLLDVVVKQIQSINNDDELKDALAQIVLDNTRNFMPYDTGYLDEHTYVKDGKIIYDTPYARRLYEGIGFNFKTEKHPGACARWLEVGMAFNYSAIKWQMDEAIKKRLKDKKSGGGGKVIDGSYEAELPFGISMVMMYDTEQSDINHEAFEEASNFMDWVENADPYPDFGEHYTVTDIYLYDQSPEIMVDTQQSLAKYTFFGVVEYTYNT